MTLALGLFAAALTIASFVAQVWKIVRTRDTAALATPTWVLTTVAFAVWTGYGVVRVEWPIILPNAVCFLLAGFILTLKLLPRERRDAVADAIAPPDPEARAGDERGEAREGALGVPSQAAVFQRPPTAARSR